MELIKQQETKHGVYFANLEAYNQGRMIGGWLYPLDYETLEGFLEAIKQVTRNADEVAVHDYDDFVDMGEYPCHELLYNLVHTLNDQDISMELIKKYADYHYYDMDWENFSELLDDMQDKFRGFYNDFDEFAQMYVEETNTEFQEMSDYLKSYFDYESYARDLKHDFTVIDLDNHIVAIYRNY